jgi:hypothetical protein
LDRAAHCEAIDQAISDWPKEGEKTNRLEVGLAMFAAGLIDRKCLQSEADSEAAFATDPSALYYLAQSFIHSDEAEISDSYLNHVCVREPKSPSCDLSHIVSAWSNEDWDELNEAFEKMKKPDVVTSIWAIRHFMKRGQPEKAFAWIKNISPNKPLATYLQVQRIKALWLMNRYPEAKVGALQALETLPDEWQFDLASWMCVQETTLDCHSSASVSCQWLADQKTDGLEDDPQFAIARLHTSECSDSGEIDYADMAGQIPSKSWRKLIKAVAKVKTGDRNGGLAMLHDLMDDEGQPDEFRAEAYRRYIHEADTKGLRTLMGRSSDIPQGIWREIQPRFTMELSRRKISPSERLPASTKESGK